MPSAALPPFFANTENDHGARPVVLGYIGAGITLLVTIIRVGLTVNRAHGLGNIDDITFVAAAVLAVAASITLERAAGEGLGRHADALSNGELNAYERFSYATALLSIFAQSAAKISVASLYDRLVPRQDKKRVRILMGVIGAWIVFAVFATAFACDGNLTWGHECTTKGYLTFPVNATNLLTDGLLGCWMLPRIWRLQASLHDRLLPCLLMGSRLLVCVLQLGWIIYAANWYARGQVLDGPDATWTQTSTAIIAISVTHLSVITATIPRINSFIADMQTRRAGIALTQRDYDSYKHSKSGSKNASGNRSAVRSANVSGKWGRSKSPEPAGVLDSFRPDRSGVRNDFSHSKAPEEIEMDNRDQVETGSQSSLRGNAVYWKTEFRWEEEYTGQNSSAAQADADGIQKYRY